MNKLLLLLLTVLLPLTGLHAQTQITDFVYQESDKSSSPSKFIQYKGLILFTATTSGEGRELWVSDGSGENTRILKDINPGSGNGVIPSREQGYAVLDGQLFFIADDGENGTQIWSTSGTGQTTKRITNIPGLNTTNLTLVGNHIFFLSKNKNELQIWKSDGTASGTKMVKSGLSIWNSPSYEGAANGLFFFTFQPEGSNDSRLWRSDGSTAGTFPVTQEMNGNGGGLQGTSGFTQYRVFKGELYFVVRSSSIFSYPTTVGIMKTDGSVANTVPVKAVHEGNTRLVSFADVIEVNGKLYFSFFEGEYKRLFIWESDGTAAGTRKVYDEYGERYYTTSNLSTDGQDLVFVGKSEGGGVALLKLRLDGYVAEEIKELESDMTAPLIFTWPYAYQLNRLPDNSFLLFDPIFNPVAGWVSDLTAANTKRVPQLKNGREVGVLNKEVFFASATPQKGVELWKSDFAFTNPQLVLDIDSSMNGLSYAVSAVVGNRTFFMADDGIHGMELWVYDSGTGEKQLVKDIQLGSKSSFPNQFVVHNDDVYFTAYNDENGRWLWRSDGTAAGTAALKGLDGMKEFHHLVKRQGKLYFIARHDNQYVLCVTDGTNIEKIKALGLNTYGYAFEVSKMVSAGDYIFFILEADGGDLWRSDGTEGGTVKIKDLNAIKHLVAVNNKVYFSAVEPYLAEYVLWQSDGTEAGTTKVVEVGAEYPSAPESLFDFNGRLVYSALTPEHGREYWITDGISGGTKQLGDIYPGTSGSATSATHYAIYNGSLYFAANDGTHGTELWKTDGTAAGTVFVHDINKGANGSLPRYLVADGERLYFSAYTPESGAEPWSSGGTASTTRQLFDIEAGPKSSNPSGLLLCSDELLFFAEKVSSGRQLWSAEQREVTGIEEPSESEVFTLYPNPTSDYLYFEKSNKPLKLQRIIKLNGQSVPVKEDKPGKVYVGNLLPGLYLLVAEVDNKAVVRKFIKR